jgi:hypothetical protein
MSSDRERLLERKGLVERDLAELAAQLEDGEIDAATGEQLRATYESELTEIDEKLRTKSKRPAEVNVPVSSKEEVGERAAPPPVPPASAAVGWRRSPQRVIVGAVILIAVFSLAIFLAARDAADDGTSEASPGGLIVDPASVSNEQLEAVVAANPNINAMRMALADRYFADEESSPALGHYLFIADNDPTPEEETKALARVGWMAYRTGLAQEADQYVEASLAIDPGYSEALLYRGFITLYGIGDVAAAIPQLEAARGLPNLSDNVIAQIEDALSDARNRLDP